MIDAGGTERPLIDQANGVVELVTKTANNQEADDDNHVSAFAELATKTDTQIEQDDASTFGCLEMSTKTEAQLESDDTSPSIRGMFL